MVLSRAVASLDHFPSIAQLKEIADYLQREKSPGTSHGKPVPENIDDAVEVFPWPNSVIGLIMGIADDKGRGLSPFGLRSLGITADEAKYLYDCWVAQDWKNEWAMEILAKAETNAPLAGITGGT